MNKVLIILLIIFCSATSLFAAHPQRRMSPEEFRTRQQAFITEKAGLTKDEASKFFPLYYELQDKKKELNDKAWELIRKGKDPGTTEAQYDEIINTVFDTRIKIDELDKEYFKKFRKILSGQKVYKVQHAEIKFHRELLKRARQKEFEKEEK